jgi:hypothetical protein
MTRFLSESLQAAEPSFRLGVQRLELAHGSPSHDIRLSTEVMRGTKLKLHSLGLDAHNTTPEELYHALQHRLGSDDAKLVRNLQTRAATHISAEADVVAGMAHVLNGVPIKRQAYGMKSSVFKTLIKKQPPKKVMKQLGYRSLDSLLKHEAPAVVLSAAVMVESPAWQRSLLDSYKRLTAKDFETRQLSVIYPKSQRWQVLAGTVASDGPHNVMTFPELASIVLLPLKQPLSSGSVTASLSLALHAINEIRAAGTYLRVSQVRPDFGTLVQMIARSEPQLQAKLLDQPISWHVVQRYYARAKHLFQAELFEPHLQLEDLSWHSVEKVLAHIEPSFAFWENSAHLGMPAKHLPVSLNVLDTALGASHHLPYEQRLAHYFQASLWHELMLRYLRPSVIEETILQELQPQLAYAPALAA